jgi:hypothetical protein
MAELTRDEVGLVQTLQRYLALHDPLGGRATVPNIVRYFELQDAAAEAQRRGDTSRAMALRLQTNRITRQPVWSWAATIAIAGLLFLLALWQVASAIGSYQQIGPSVDRTVAALTQPDLSLIDLSRLTGSVLPPRAPDPQGAFQPFFDAYRRNAQVGAAALQGAVVGLIVHVIAASVLAIFCVLYATLQPHELIRRWIVPAAAKFMTG